MENLEIMNNGEVIETTEEIVSSGSGNGFKTVAIIGLTVLVGTVAYKYIVKPTIARLKAKKNQSAIQFVIDDEFATDQGDCEEES